LREVGARAVGLVEEKVGEGDNSLGEQLVVEEKATLVAPVVVLLIVVFFICYCHLLLTVLYYS